MKKFRKVIIYIILIILAVLFLIPLYAAISMSFKSMQELATNFWGIPKDFIWQNFTIVWGRNTLGLKYYFLNSFKLTIPAMTIMIISAVFAAYPLAKYKLKGQKIMMTLLIFGITIPHQVLIIPVFKMLNAMYLYDTIWGLILVHIGFGLPFSIFLLRNYMVQIPTEIIDSAKVDGCSHFRIIFKIIIPLSMPIIAVLAILSFTWIFNEFFFALILTNGIHSTPASVAVAFLNATESSTQWNLQAAACLIVSLPTLVIFLAFQRYFIKGIMLGAVKG